MNIKSFLNAIIVICLFFSATVAINSDSLNRIALYLAIPLAFLLSFLKSRKLAPNKYIAILFIIYLWDAFSCLWARYSDPAHIELHKVLGAVLMTYIMSVNVREKNMRKYMYLTFILLYIGAWYYTLTHSLISSVDGSRLNDEKLNANTMAYYTFYVTICLYFLSSLTNSTFWKKCYIVLFLLMIPISGFVALTTASRQVLLIQLPLFALLLFERYFINVSNKRKFTFASIIVLSLIIIIPYSVDIYNNSYLAERASADIKEDSRWLLLNDAIEVGLEHFPFGVGAGNYVEYSYNKHISHCSYTELFANLGIIGLFLYLYLLIFFVKKQWYRYKITRDRNYIIFLFFGLFFLFYQLFFVFYNDLWLISFFILIASHSEAYHKEKLAFNKLQVQTYNPLI